MALFEQINKDIISTMKAKEADKLTALRAVKSELLLLKTSVGAKDEISEEEEIKVLQKMVKQRKDSAEIYKTQNREDLFQKEMNEAKFIQAYLPKQMTDAELTGAITEMINKTGAASMKDMGKVMGIASKELAGKAEGKLIAAKVKELLSK
ncbi:MAG: GatB/YqeY domain-containing protein [Bacteroidales bacterium]|nr:GatB/YqeY domain-containing protein [Bacteroidales bacterium]